jgi:hypothetical protein
MRYKAVLGDMRRSPSGRVRAGERENGFVAFTEKPWQKVQYIVAFL